MTLRAATQALFTAIDLCAIQSGQWTWKEDHNTYHVGLQVAAFGVAIARLGHGGDAQREHLHQHQHHQPAHTPSTGRRDILL